jgi:molybdate-binding protein
VADAGLGIQAAALQLGLHFVPLIEEDYFLACATASLAHPGVKRLCEVLAGEHWRRILSRLPGYLPVQDPGRPLPVEYLFPSSLAPQASCER